MTSGGSSCQAHSNSRPAAAGGGIKPSQRRHLAAFGTPISDACPSPTTWMPRAVRRDFLHQYRERASAVTRPAIKKYSKTVANQDSSVENLRLRELLMKAHWTASWVTRKVG